MKQPWVWVTWLLTVLILLSITRNPLYLVIILLCVLFVGLSLRDSGSSTQRPFAVWKLAVWVLLFTILFNALTSHHGLTVLFTIPGNLPIISGKVTLEAVVYGAINGLILIGMLSSFYVLNLALPIRDLVSLIPRAFFPVAVVTSIAVTYLPTTIRQFRQIRDAQAIRGHQMRSLRDWLPLFMPLLVDGLEHAMQLSEAMTARGFASSKPGTAEKPLLPRILLLAGLVLLTGGWFMQLGKAGMGGWTLLAAGGILIVAGLWMLGKHSNRTIYHPPAWHWQDVLVLVLMACILLVVVLPVPTENHQSLFYDPYPKVTVPLFDPLLGLAMLLLLVPGVFIIKRS